MGCVSCTGKYDNISFNLKTPYRVRGPVRTQRPYGDAFSIKKASTAQTRYEIKKTKAPKNQATIPS